MTTEDVRERFYEEIISKMFRREYGTPMADAFCKRQNIDITIKSLCLEENKKDDKWVLDLVDWEKILQYSSLKKIMKSDDISPEEVKEHDEFVCDFMKAIGKRVEIKLTSSKKSTLFNGYTGTQVYVGDFASIKEGIKSILHEFTLLNEELSAETLEYMLRRGYGTLNEIIENWDDIKRRLLEKGESRITSELEEYIKKRG